MNSLSAQFEEQTTILFEGNSHASWGDYNNDDRLDILIGSKIYKNNGDKTFTEQTGISLPDGAGSWGDYNNDGFLDILVGSKIYKNNGNETFTEQTDISNIYISDSGNWADFDHDGLLDIW